MQELKQTLYAHLTVVQFYRLYIMQYMVANPVPKGIWGGALGEAVPHPLAEKNVDFDQQNAMSFAEQNSCHKFKPIRANTFHSLGPSLS